MPCWREHDDAYVATEPGLLPASELVITVTDRGDEVARLVLPVTTVPAPVEAPDLEVTQWFHADCLATYYGVETWSEEHWEAIGRQMRSAARMGSTMLLTPVWTPPLDTERGANRPRTQLLDIELVDGRYSFGHARLDRWMELAAAAGLSQVEVPHLFTQWGATAAPQVWVRVDGEERQLFGWHTDALDPEYQNVLGQVVPFLIDYFGGRVGLGNTIFHVSDEPTDEHLASYGASAASVAPLLEGCRVVDALSHPEFADLVQVPVVATDAVGAFRDAGIEPGWVYHCIAQSWGVANRFIAQEGIRTRALGWQLYKAGAVGFLHWGFNFYNAQLSRRPIDPFHDTSAGGGFIGGDPFVVYPGPGYEPLESQRHRLFAEAMGDLAAAQRAEKLIGRDAVLGIVDPEGNLDYAAGWVTAEEWLRRRDALDRAAAAALG